MLTIAARFSALLGAAARRKLLEELGQTSDQPVPSADDVQTAFVLMFFQDFVQSAFKLIHTCVSRRSVELGRLS